MSTRPPMRGWSACQGQAPAPWLAATVAKCSACSWGLTEVGGRAFCARSTRARSHVVRRVLTRALSPAARVPAPSPAASATETGERVTLKAFSGQLPPGTATSCVTASASEPALGSWYLEGWAPPLARVTHHTSEYRAVMARTRALSERLEATDGAGDTAGAERLRAERRALSTALLARIRESYDLGEGDDRAPLTLEAVYAPAAVPGGAGDCAAAKLVRAAARAGVEPEGMCEWWAFGDAASKRGKRRGGGSESGASAVAGRVYGTCGRCAALLPAMLCGSCAADGLDRASASVGAAARAHAAQGEWLAPLSIPNCRVEEW